MGKKRTAIRCKTCGAIVAWSIPTGIYDHGIPRVEIKKRDNYVETWRGFEHINLCTECAKR